MKASGTSDHGWCPEVWRTVWRMTMINYTSEYTIVTGAAFDSGIEGKLPHMVSAKKYWMPLVPGWSTNICWTASQLNEHMISSPGGISRLWRRYIKSEWLATAKQNNPLTIANSKTNNKALKSAKLCQGRYGNLLDIRRKPIASCRRQIAAAEKFKGWYGLPGGHDIWRQICRQPWTVWYPAQIRAVWMLPGSRRQASIPSVYTREHPVIKTPL